jgi:hypothetical protein
MERLGMNVSERSRLCAAVLMMVVASGSLAVAQGADNRAIDQAQRAVSDRITSQEGGAAVAVRFGRDASTEFPSNTNVRVRGTGSVVRNNDGRTRPFSYEAVVDNRTSNVSNIRYNWSGDWNGQAGGGTATTNTTSTNRLTGTYRFNPSRSDDPVLTADRVTRGLPPGQQKKLNAAIAQRLEAPDTLALERSGNTITMASTHASAVTFRADGRAQTEPSRNGRQMSTTATLSGDRLVVTTTGDRSLDYQVTFEPLDNGRSLRVTRSLTQEDLRAPVVARSVYDRTSNTPQFDNYSETRAGRGGSANRGRSANRNGFPAESAPSTSSLVPDGTQVLAVLNENLSTKQARNGDRVTLTVRSPAQYADAIIEGTLTGVARSGQLSGRAEMSFDFNTIRLRNGRASDFAGSIESVKLTNGDTVRVDNEGAVQDEGSQTQRTVVSSGIGAAIGAVIGAIAGGGSGSAIGAAVGAGAGAGSVFIQGRNDLDMTSGTEFQIRARAPQ